jgi:hypothetical protein
MSGRRPWWAVAVWEIVVRWRVVVGELEDIEGTDRSDGLRC